jgi:hypothetical protein
VGKPYFPFSGTPDKAESWTQQNLNEYKIAYLREPNMRLHRLLHPAPLDMPATVLQPLRFRCSKRSRENEDTARVHGGASQVSSFLIGQRSRTLTSSARKCVGVSAQVRFHLDCTSATGLSLKFEPNTRTQSLADCARYQGFNQI